MRKLVRRLFEVWCDDMNWVNVVVFLVSWLVWGFKVEWLIFSFFVDWDIFRVWIVVVVGSEVKGREFEEESSGELYGECDEWIVEFEVGYELVGWLLIILWKNLICFWIDYLEYVGLRLRGNRLCIDWYVIVNV